MIVRNEAAVISRCLESVRPYISHWTICDTGSTDRTPELIEEFMAEAGIPGKLYRDAWINFGHNRSLSVERARGTADYHLLLDADMILQTAEDYQRQSFQSSESTEATTHFGTEAANGLFDQLTEDAYLLPFAGSIDYSVIRLVSDQHSWQYLGSTHEYVFSRTANPPVKLPGILIKHFEDGGSRSEKYERDIRLLTEDYKRGMAEHKDDPGVRSEQNEENVYTVNLPRTAFYLAQSYRDSMQYEKALDWYEKRAVMGGWEEETWAALYQLGRIQELLNYDWRIILNSYLQAYNYRPWRLEPVYRIARFYREHQQWSLGYLFARLIVEVGYPEDILFVERAIYERQLVEEYVICCRNTGREGEAERVQAILQGAKSKRVQSY